jgi:hypothetical protein
MTKRCFVISQIGQENSEERKKADRIYTFIKRACEQSGYKTVRADEIEKPGFINSQIIAELFDAGLVIADLTGYNPNVFYELAVRHYSDMPVIHLMEKPNQIPFDIAGNRAIYYGLKAAEDGLALVDSLCNYIAAVEEDEDDEKPSQNPVTQVLNVRKYEQSENPEDRTNATILSLLQELREDIGDGLRGLSSGVTGIVESLDMLEDHPTQVSNISAEAIKEIIGLAKLLNTYTEHEAQQGSNFNQRWISAVRDKLKTFALVSNAPEIVVRVAIKELEKGTEKENTLSRPSRPRLDIDEEFPAEEDLPF